MIYINSKLGIKPNSKLIITNKIDENGYLIVRMEPEENITIRVKPLTLTDKQEKFKNAILKIKERPYEYFRISQELQSDPGIIAQALLGFKNIVPKDSEKQMVDFIIISLNDKLEKCFTNIEEQKEKVR